MTTLSYSMPKDIPLDDMAIAANEKVRACKIKFGMEVLPGKYYDTVNVIDNQNDINVQHDNVQGVQINLSLSGFMNLVDMAYSGIDHNSTKTNPTVKDLYDQYLTVKSLTESGSVTDRIISEFITKLKNP